MKRSINYRKKQVTYVIPVEEFLKKLGITEELANIHWSTGTGTIRINCHNEEEK